MPVPKHDKFVVDAAFLAPGYKGIAQFVSVVVREQPFYGRVYGINVGLFCMIRED